MFNERFSFLDGPYDSMPEEVRKVTYKPSFFNLPFPAQSIIDEFRNKYRVKQEERQANYKMEKAFAKKLRKIPIAHRPTIIKGHEEGKSKLAEEKKKRSIRVTVRAIRGQ